MTFQEALKELRDASLTPWDKRGGLSSFNLCQDFIHAIAEQVEADRSARILSQVAHQSAIIMLQKKLGDLQENHDSHFQGQLSKKLSANHPNRSLRE